MQNAFRLPRLYPIIDTELYESRGIPVVEAAETLLDGGIRILQFRHKAGFTEKQWQQAKRIASLSSARGAQFILNDRADYAYPLRAGVHLGQDDLPPAAARRVVGPDTVIGFSTHNEEQFRQAEGAPVDYLAFGPIFATLSKKNPDPVAGVAELKRLRPLTIRPVVAIGGITFENAAVVLDAGADSIAVISALLTEANGLTGLRDTVRKWISELGA